MACSFLGGYATPRHANLDDFPPPPDPATSCRVIIRVAVHEYHNLGVSSTTGF